MVQPTQREIIEHVREHFGISAMDVLSIMKTPTHPKELRDEFAAKAMQSYLLSPDRDDFTYYQWSVVSYDMADAMLEARAAE